MTQGTNCWQKFITIDGREPVVDEDAWARTQQIRCEMHCVTGDERAEELPKNSGSGYRESIFGHRARKVGRQLRTVVT